MTWQEADLNKELTIQVRKVIGPFAAPKKIFLVDDLPKTRSGKIMRRVLRKIIAGEGDQLGDLSSIADPGVVDESKFRMIPTRTDLIAQSKRRWATSRTRRDQVYV